MVPGTFLFDHVHVWIKLFGLSQGRGLGNGCVAWLVVLGDRCVLINRLRIRAGLILREFVAVGVDDVLPSTLSVNIAGEVLCCSC